MKTIFFLLALLLSASLASGQTRCICLSVKPTVTAKIDSTHSYVKEVVLQYWPYAWQVPDGSECFRDFHCGKKIEVEIQEPYWGKPRQMTFQEFKHFIYGHPLLRR